MNRRLTNARLSDGKPLPVGELKKLACEADILPAIYKIKGQKLWLGRRTRIATPGQKAALTLRDQGCVGCDAAPHWCQAHHIDWWSNGGPTDLDNLVMVCTRCHHNIHDHSWEVHQDPDGRYTVHPPPDPFPDTGTTNYQPAQHNPILRN